VAVLGLAGAWAEVCATTSIASTNKLIKITATDFLIEVPSLGFE